MRKSVLFLLGVLYLVSVVVVTFFGIQARMDQFKVYITSLEITNEEVTLNSNNDKVVKLVFKQNEETVSFWVETKVEPSNATNKQLEYILSDSNGNPMSEEKVVVSDKGEVVFKMPCLTYLRVNTTDGSSLHESLILSCTKKRS